MKVRKRPIVVDAIQWNGDWEELRSWLDTVSDGGGTSVAHTIFPDKTVLTIKTLEGYLDVSMGCWIICGINGEWYPVQPDIFEKTYEVIG